jgi:hypothetical protein
MTGFSPTSSIFPWQYYSTSHLCLFISYNKSQRDALFLRFIGKELYMFRTDLLSIIRSLNTVFTAIGICHTSYVDC